MTRGFEIAKGFEEKGIQLPMRMTTKSAGYDFEAAADVVIPSIWKIWLSKLLTKQVEKTREISDELMERYQVWELSDVSEDEDNQLLTPTLVPTGIKAFMSDDEFLGLLNRSSNPLKKFLMLANGKGIIDKDYHNNKKNDGHIMFQFINFGFTDRQILKGEAIGQGIFQKFLKAENGFARESEEIRAGGHGHTTK